MNNFNIELTEKERYEIYLIEKRAAELAVTEEEKKANLARRMQRREAKFAQKLAKKAEVAAKIEQRRAAKEQLAKDVEQKLKDKHDASIKRWEEQRHAKRQNKFALHRTG